MNGIVDKGVAHTSDGLAQQLLNALPHAACVIDRTGKILMANELCRHTTPQQALSRAELLKTNIFALIEKFNCADPMLRRFGADVRELLEGRSDSVACDYLCMNAGRPRWFELRAAQLADDEAGRLLVTQVEVTARRTAQAQVVALDAKLEETVQARTAEMQRELDERDEFARSVAHDLRNPLCAIDGFARMLLQSPDPALTREAHEILQCIARSASQMSEMLEGLRALSRGGKDAPLRQPVDLATLAREVADGLAYRYRHRKVNMTIGELPPVESDPRLLRVVMQNLIENAWKYTARTAQATVEVGSSTEADGRVTYYVRDNGVGFAEGVASKIFLPFRKYPGANSFAGNGVGLTTVKRVVDTLKGRVWAQSKPGLGATFFFQLG